MAALKIGAAVAVLVEAAVDVVVVTIVEEMIGRMD